MFRFMKRGGFGRLSKQFKIKKKNVKKRRRSKKRRIFYNFGMLKAGIRIKRPKTSPVPLKTAPVNSPAVVLSKAIPTVKPTPSESKIAELVKKVTVANPGGGKGVMISSFNLNSARAFVKRNPVRKKKVVKRIKRTSNWQRVLKQDASSSKIRKIMLPLSALAVAALLSVVIIKFTKKRSASRSTN